MNIQYIVFNLFNNYYFTNKSGTYYTFSGKFTHEVFSPHLEDAYYFDTKQDALDAIEKNLSNYVLSIIETYTTE